MVISGKSCVNSILNIGEINLKLFQMTHDVIKKSLHEKFAKKYSVFIKKSEFSARVQ